MTQPEDKHQDDLEYLSALGFESVLTEETDLEELRGRARNRAFSWSNGFYFSGISLLAGVFIGISLFFVFDQPVPDRIPVEPGLIIRDTSQSLSTLTPTLNLDTIVVTENFHRPAPPVAVAVNSGSASVANDSMESPLVLQARDIDVSTALNVPLNEEKIRFIINSPVFYLHDLKITNYTTLYFKKNQFVKLGGTLAGYADHAAAEASRLKESPDIFLHEQISEAMFYFKKSRYDQCINTLNLVAEYNKEDLNCDFYLGMCFYHKMNYKKAVEFFDRCIVNPNNTFLQEAAYYKAISLLSGGSVEDGLRMLRQIADEGEFYSVKAKQVLSARNE